MGLEICRATTAEEVEAVQRLRYAVYVEELGRYRGAADDATGRFAEPEDDHSWIFYVRDGNEVIATSRLTWGGHGFSDRQMTQYDRAPFLDELPADVMAVAERLAVLPPYRGAGLFEQIVEHNQPFVESHGLRVVIGCCEPHLLSLYLAKGQRTYADRNINSPEAGYLIPLVTFIPDVEALRGVGHTTQPGELAAVIERVLAQSGTVRSHTLSHPDTYWTRSHPSTLTDHSDLGPMQQRPATSWASCSQPSSPALRARPRRRRLPAWLDRWGLGLADPALFLDRSRVAVSEGPPSGAGCEQQVRLDFATSAAILERIVTAMGFAVRSQPGA